MGFTVFRFMMNVSLRAALTSVIMFSSVVVTHYLNSLVHPTLCSDAACNAVVVVNNYPMHAWPFFVGVFIYAIKVKFWLACINDVLVTDLQACVTTQTKL